eukprot:15467626-Alexandrium_andersonii.AAC.1
MGPTSVGRRTTSGLTDVRAPRPPQVQRLPAWHPPEPDHTQLEWGQGRLDSAGYRRHRPRRGHGHHPGDGKR